MKNKQPKYIQIEVNDPKNKILKDNLSKIQEATGLGFRHAIITAVAHYKNEVVNK